MLKFKTSCTVLAYLSSNLLNEVGLSLFRYFEVGLRVCDIVVKKFTFAISSSDEFLYYMNMTSLHRCVVLSVSVGACRPGARLVPRRPTLRRRFGTGVRTAHRQ